MKQTDTEKAHKQARVIKKVIHWELCEFNCIDKKYTHWSESVLENMAHKILWDFEIQTNHSFQLRRPDVVLTNKRERTRQLVYFSHFSRLQIENRRKRKLDEWMEIPGDKKIAEYWSDNNISQRWSLWNNS